ncbi:hypothetical protein JCM8097_000876 [Rhodosporidiobolus ruineniae]
MPVGHRRFNNPRPDPNPNITFIRVLEDLPDSGRAQELLEAIAAQFRPIMKEYGFGVNSLVEHEWNPTFAGRNWNAGEVIELVLRRRDGTFAPYQFLLYVMCHELAHIKEMNHSWAFKKVNQQIRAALAHLRAQRYTGDGFWSSGQSLTGYNLADVPLGAQDEPVYTCGGANKKRGQWKRRRAAASAGTSRARGSAVKLGTTGRQTAIAPKAGGRVKRKGVFEGEGNVLSEDPEMSSKGRRAQAKGAVAARAAAAEARLAAEARAQAAERRARASPPSPEKKPKPELDVDWDAEGQELGGWETDEEDKPNVKLEEDEKAWLREDMREWRREVKTGGVGTSGSSSSAGGSGSGKKRKAASPSPTPARKTSSSASTSSASTKGKGKAAASSSSSSKRRISSSAGADDLSGLDLTPEERAWLEADQHHHGGVKQEEDSDDEIEIVSGAGGKKARVAYMAMPGIMGGTGKKDKGKSKGNDSDGSLPDPSTLLESPSKKRPSSTGKKPTASTSTSKGKGKSVAFDLDSDDDDDEDLVSDSEDEQPASKRKTSSPKHRGPMKFFSTGSDVVQYAKQPKPAVASQSKKQHVQPLISTDEEPDTESDSDVVVVGSSLKAKKASGKIDKGKAKRISPSPVSTDEEDSDVEVNRKSKSASAASRSKGKQRRISPSPSPPPVAAKKPRKTRSDKGVKRGPRKKPAAAAAGSDDDAPAPAAKAKKASKPGCPRKEPKTFDEKLKAAPAAERRKSDKELLKEIEQEERAEKGAEMVRKIAVGEAKPKQKIGVKKAGAAKSKKKGKTPQPIRPDDDDDDEVDQLDSTTDEDRKPAPKKKAKLATASPTKKSSNKDKGKGKAVHPLEDTDNEDIKPVLVGLTLTAQRVGVGSNGGAGGAGPATPFSGASTSKNPTKPRRDDFATSPHYPSTSRALGSPTSSTSSRFSPPPLGDGDFADLPSSEQDAFISSLAEQDAHNARVAEKRKRKQRDEADKAAKEEEAKRRIEARAKEIEREAAGRGPSVTQEVKSAGWGRNVFSDGVEADDLEAKKRLEGILGLDFGSGAGVPQPAGTRSGVMRGGAGPSRPDGRTWSCSSCTFANDGAIGLCQMCGLGERESAASWNDAGGA